MYVCALAVEETGSSITHEVQPLPPPPPTREITSYCIHAKYSQDTT
jgi:hypothetical protein